MSIPKIISSLKQWMSNEDPVLSIEMNFAALEEKLNPEMTPFQQVEGPVESAKLLLKAAQQTFHKNIQPYEKVRLTLKQMQEIEAAAADQQRQLNAAMERIREVNAIMEADYDAKLGNNTYKPAEVQRGYAINPNAKTARDKAANDIANKLNKAIKNGDMMIIQKKSPDYYDTHENKFDQELLRVKNSVEAARDETIQLREQLQESITATIAAEKEKK